MATYLFRLGRAAYIRRRLVLGIWIVLLVSSVVAAATLSAPTSSSFSIPGTESGEATEVEEEGAGFQMGAVEQELLRAFGADDE